MSGCCGPKKRPKRERAVQPEIERKSSQTSLGKKILGVFGLKNETLAGGK